MGSRGAGLRTWREPACRTAGTAVAAIAGGSGHRRGLGFDDHGAVMIDAREATTAGWVYMVPPR